MVRLLARWRSLPRVSKKSRFRFRRRGHELRHPFGVRRQRESDALPGFLATPLSPVQHLPAVGGLLAGDCTGQSGVARNPGKASDSLCRRTPNGACSAGRRQSTSIRLPAEPSDFSDTLCRARLLTIAVASEWPGGSSRVPNLAQDVPGASSSSTTIGSGYWSQGDTQFQFFVETPFLRAFT